MTPDPLNPHDPPGLPASAGGAGAGFTDAQRDALIVRRVLEGDREAFRGLVERHQRRVYLAALRVVIDRDEAEDIAQDTFLKAYTHLARYDERWAFSTWISTIATRTALSARRARLTRQGAAPRDIEQALAGSAPEDPRRAADRRQWLARLREELAKLGERMRLMIGLYHLDGLPIEQIAAMLGENPSTVKVTLHRARRLLRQRLLHWEAMPALPVIEPIGGLEPNYDPAPEEEKRHE